MMKTCCEGLGPPRCWFLSGVARSLTESSSFWFVSLQRWNEELCRAGIKEGVSYGLVFHSPHHLTALHLIPIQHMFKFERTE